MTRDPERIQRLLELVGFIWRHSPDLRLGQIVENAKAFSTAPETDTFYIEDDVIEDGLKKLAQLPPCPRKS